MQLLDMFYDTAVVWTKESNICKNGIFILKPVKGTFLRNEEWAVYQIGEGSNVYFQL